MRKRARDESTSINVIYDDQLEMLSQGENSADVLAQLPSLESIRPSLYKSRHEHTPILPIHRRDVSLSGRYTKTCSEEDFLLVDDGDDDKITQIGQCNQYIIPGLSLPGHIEPSTTYQRMQYLGGGKCSWG